ncbi:hypothetical protein C5167_026919 [Papaver somniferum]|nr:hypothetical protein C5167_026919 [Papaver somniferum]
MMLQVSHLNDIGKRLDSEPVMLPSCVTSVVEYLVQWEELLSTLHMVLDIELEQPKLYMGEAKLEWQK